MCMVGVMVIITASWMVFLLAVLEVEDVEAYDQLASRLPRRCVRR